MKKTGVIPGTAPASLVATHLPGSFTGGVGAHSHRTHGGSLGGGQILNTETKKLTRGMSAFPFIVKLLSDKAFLQNN